MGKKKREEVDGEKKKKWKNTVVVEKKIGKDMEKK